MKSTWRIWLIFSLCLVLVLAAMAWISVAALRSEAAEAAALAHSDFEESVRTSLLRMQSDVNSIIAQEASRPAVAFSPVDAAKVSQDASLIALTDYVLLHFQLSADGQVVSPQVPRGKAHGPSEGKPEFNENLALARRRQETLTRLLRWDEIALRIPRGSNGNTEPFVVVQNEAQGLDGLSQLAANNDFQIGNRANRSPAQQQELNTQEYVARQNSFQRSAQRNSKELTWSAGAGGVGPMHPIWVGDQLLLVRWVCAGKKDYLQGAWLDWPTLRTELLAAVADKFPAADLEPLMEADLGNPARALAGLPAEFLPGSEPLALIEPWSPLRTSLAMAWGCTLLASAAVGLLLFGVVRLSERRAAFVSAVTHELRTPLTTFRMYAEMLSSGMVREPQRQREYLDTLRLESDRLSHLVENVLSYARLERGRSPRRLQGVALPALLERVESRLRDRAKQSGFELTVEIAPEATSLATRSDPAVVEQILLNLVDNACKYAAGSSPGVIHLEAFGRGKLVCLRVRDHGPGIAPADQRRVFQPFRKSARDAAHSAPGVGLGLALCRRLARAMGGDLRLEDHAADGAALVVTLRSASR